MNNYSVYDKYVHLYAHGNMKLNYRQWENASGLHSFLTEYKLFYLQAI